MRYFIRTPAGSMHLRELRALRGLLGRLTALDYCRQKILAAFDAGPYAISENELNRLCNGVINIVVPLLTRPNAELQSFDIAVAARARISYVFGEMAFLVLSKTAPAVSQERLDGCAKTYKNNVQFFIDRGYIRLLTITEVTIAKLQGKVFA